MDSNHLPPRCSALSGLLLNLRVLAKGRVLSGLNQPPYDSMVADSKEALSEYRVVVRLLIYRLLPKRADSPYIRNGAARGAT